MGLQLRVTCERLDLLWNTLEAVLTSPRAPWEPDRFAKAQETKKKQK